MELVLYCKATYVSGPGRWHQQDKKLADNRTHGVNKKNVGGDTTTR